MLLELPTDFPSEALAEAYTIVRAGQYDAQQKHRLAVDAYNLAGWALGRLEPGRPLVGFEEESTELTDAEAHAILATSGGEPGLMTALPIPPDKIVQLAFWLLRAAGFVLPILL